MNPSQRAHLALVLLAALVSAILSHRSLRVPSLRPAARACALYAAADLLRLGIDVWGRDGWRGWGWIDVVVWCGMTGVWCGVLWYDERKTGPEQRVGR